MEIRKQENNEAENRKGSLGMEDQEQTCVSNPYRIIFTGVPQGEEGDKGLESLFEEIIVENSCNLKKKLDIQVMKV